MILIGTSGYDYEDWRGSFYPDKLPKKNWLEYYSNQFKVIELNFSYYRMPSQGQLASMVERSQGRVGFAVKAHQLMTHDRTASSSDFALFNSSVKELRDADRLETILAQFPHSFRQCEENRTYIKRLADNLGTPLVVEMRQAEWADDLIRDWLGRIGVGYCCVDEPDLPGLMPKDAVFTASPAYVRFHGRNAQKWYEHNAPAERYDYRYNQDELTGWAKKIKSLESKAGKVLVFFNNHFQAKAVDGAKALEKILVSSNLTSRPPSP